MLTHIQTKRLKKQRMLNNSLIKIALAPFAILILHILATVLGWYELFWWFDMPMHFLGGAAIALSSYYLFDDFADRDRLSIQWLPLKILILLAFTSLAAVSWEFLEFAMDRYVDTNMQPSILDTVKDLAIGLSGGGLIALAISPLKKILKK